MSVVNDVLKNLNQRHARENMARHIPHLYDSKPAPPYILWLVLAITLSLSLVVAVFQWQQSNYVQQSIELPSDLFLLDEKDAFHEPSQNNYLVSESITSQNKHTELNNEKTSLKQAAPEKKSSDNLSNQNIKPTLRRSNSAIVNKSQQSESVDQVVAALKVGNHEAVQADLSKTPKSIQGEIQLRMMVKESPEKVLPYINNNFGDYSKNPSLLAMAAQAQQRIQQHFSAISIYKQLIQVQPKDARWRAGIAISLEASGEVNAARRMYQLALSMPGLPRSLAAFSQKRLSALK